MNQSMTGYAKIEHKNSNKAYAIEIRSVNSRFIETKINGLSDHLSIVHDLEKLIKKMFSRGKFDVNVSIIQSKNQIQQQLVEKEFESKYKMLNALKKKFKLSSEISLDTLMAMDQSFLNFRRVLEPKDLNQVRKLTQQCLEKLKESRSREGQMICKVLSKKIKTIQDKVENIKVINENEPISKLDQLKARLDKLISSANIEKGRLEEQLALLSDKLDVTEELDRLKIHLTNFETSLCLKESMGKELDFLLQEMLREVNTVGSKSQNILIKNDVVYLKTELEKVREQIQNLE